VMLHYLLEREPYVPRKRHAPRRATAVEAPTQPAKAPESVSPAEQLTRRLRNVRRPRVGL
jgi:hypothetical protein